jgi:sterol desaturase/sphingolipid hydroxylase (fatty acid hydroxylase superfamily)
VLGFGFFIPMLTVCDHMLFMFVWFLARQVQTHEAHIGYAFPYNPLYLIPFYGGAKAHDLHHKLFDCNYSSTFTIWDRLLGTYVPSGDVAKLRVKSVPEPTQNGPAPSPKESSVQQRRPHISPEVSNE